MVNVTEVSRKEIMHEHCFFFLKVSYIYFEDAASSFGKLVQLVLVQKVCRIIFRELSIQNIS